MFLEKYKKLESAREDEPPREISPEEYGGEFVMKVGGKELCRVPVDKDAAAQILEFQNKHK